MSDIAVSVGGLANYRLAADRCAQFGAETKDMEELIAAYEDYVKLIVEELNSAVGIASVHGWASDKYEAGIKARQRIKKARARKAKTILNAK